MSETSETAYETQWEGMGEKIMGLLLEYSANIEVRGEDIRMADNNKALARNLAL